MNKKYDFDLISFGMRLRHIRETYHMKQAEVAENVGVSTKTVQNWENGQKMPGIDNLYALAGYYNVSVAEILHDESYRLFNDRKDSRFKILETLYIPGTVETFFEFQEDNKDDYYAAWIFDPLTKYKYIDRVWT